jgi:hypothetical protein
MTSSASTTSYNRADDHCNINDLYTTDNIIDGFLLRRNEDDFVNPCYSHPLEDVEAVPQSLWQYNVSQEQWSEFRNGIFFQQKLHEWVSSVCLSISFITFVSFFVLLNLVTPLSRRCGSSCTPVIDPANFPGGEDVLYSLLISLLIASFVSLFVTILYQCWHSQALDRICRNTQLGTTNDLVLVRICRTHDRVHSWIELYIPSTFSLPQPV